MKSNSNIINIREGSNNSFISEFYISDTELQIFLHDYNHQEREFHFKSN